MTAIFEFESIENLKIFAEHANSIFLRWDSKGILHYINRYGANFFGYQPEELIGEHVNILVPNVESTGRDLTTLVENIIEFPDLHINVPNENIKKNGERVWILWTNKVIRDELRQVQEVLAIGNNITELVLTKEKLKIEHDKLKAVFENSSTGIVIVDSQGVILSMNKAAFKIHQFYSDLDFLHLFEKYQEEYELQYPSGETIPIVDWPLSKALRGEYVQNFGVKLIRKTTQFYRFVRYTVIPIYGNDGEVTLFIINMTDLTDRFQMEENLLAKNRELEKLNEILNNVLYISAHDLKGPINNFKLINELIQIEKSEQAKMNLLPKLQIVFQELDKTVKALNDILEIQNIDENSVKEIDLEALIQEKIRFFNSTLDDKNSFSYDLKSANKIFYVETYLRSILRNLISNAIKYQDPKNNLKISIESRREGDFIVLSIRDNGIGIDIEKYRNDIFKPFKRFNSHKDGSGIGLYLIKSMISRNGGDIKIESQIGAGSTFICYFKEYK